MTPKDQWPLRGTRVAMFRRRPDKDKDQADGAEKQVVRIRLPSRYDPGALPGYGMAPLPPSPSGLWRTGWGAQSVTPEGCNSSARGETLVRRKIARTTFSSFRCRVSSRGSLPSSSLNHFSSAYAGFHDSSVEKSSKNSQPSYFFSLNTG